MTFDVDGWMMGANPAIGGGFTIINDNGSLVARVEMLKPNFTNNDAELWAVAGAAYIAHVGDIIRSDSEVCVRWWVARGNCKSRPDLNVLCRYARALIRDKRLALVWVPREQNLAGIYNDAHKWRSGTC